MTGTNQPRPAAIHGDWGSSRLRLWLVEGGTVAARADAPGLLAGLSSPEETLRAAVAGLPGSERADGILLCGMAGARGGLSEAPYAACPATIDDWVARRHDMAWHGHTVTILPGLATRDAEGRADVMRGEEAQVFGALALGAESVAQLAILPGTHSKWVRIADGRIETFVTSPTGELRARLLGSSLAPADAADDGPDADLGFAAGLKRIAKDAALLPALFEARAGQLCDGRSGIWAAGFLSGLLIGAEIAAMTAQFGLAARPLLIGDARLAARYRQALSQFGVEAVPLDGDECVLEGLRLAHAAID